MEFSKWWVSEFKTVKFPSQGTVFDYYLDGETKKWVHWSERVPKFELDPDMPLQVSVTMQKLMHSTKQGGQALVMSCIHMGSSLPIFMKC